jgi:tRNA(Leu) C34 or U34 (ribose-2'-O)-methylase TrmL
MSNIVDLIGDGIENPWNAKTMIDAAKMFGSSCYFRDRKNLAQSVHDTINSDMQIQVVSSDQIVQTYSPVVALENLDNAADIYGFKLPAGTRAALIAGNEKFGIAHEVQQISTHFVQIPMPGTTLNTLNVAAATGVALYYLSADFGGKLQITSHPEKRRPEILFMAAGDHIELGSAIRSAGAFGWNRLFLEDREKIWFGCDRVTRSEGRGAARRGRNSIHLVPVNSESRYAFREVMVLSSSQGIPITKANLAKGPQQLVVIPDESQVDFSQEDWERLGANVQFVQIEVPSRDYVYHYRLFASIALAEIARQVGQKPGAPIRKPSKQRPVYESSLAILLEKRGEEVFLEDLQDY